MRRKAAVRVDHSASSMISVRVPEDIARKLARLAGVDLIDDPHVTLLYLGKPDTSELVDAHEVIEELAAFTQPFEARISGWGVFDTDDGYALWAGVSAKPLARLRVELETALPDGSEHGFTPHTTVSYFDDKPDLPAFSAEPFVWIVEGIDLHAGETLTRYSFTQIEIKEIRRVRSIEGARYYGLPIGAIIAPGVKPIPVQARDVRSGMRRADGVTVTDALPKGSKIEITLSDGTTRRLGKTDGVTLDADSLDSSVRNFVDDSMIVDAAQSMNAGKVPDGIAGRILRGAVADWTGADYTGKVPNRQGVAKFEEGFKLALTQGPGKSDKPHDVLARVIDAAAPNGKPTYRGAVLDADAKLEVGDVWRSAPSSWTSDLAVADSFGTRFGAYGSEDAHTLKHAVLFETDGDTRGLSISHLAGDFRTQAEYINAGEFEVTAVREETTDVTVNGNTFEQSRTVYTVKQTDHRLFDTPDVARKPRPLSRVKPSDVSVGDYYGVSKDDAPRLITGIDDNEDGSRTIHSGGPFPLHVAADGGVWADSLVVSANKPASAPSGNHVEVAKALAKGIDDGDFYEDAIAGMSPGNAAMAKQLREDMSTWDRSDWSGRVDARDANADWYGRLADIADKRVGDRPGVLARGVGADSVAGWEQGSVVDMQLSDSTPDVDVAATYGDVLMLFPADAPSFATNIIDDDPAPIPRYFVHGKYTVARVDNLDGKTVYVLEHTPNAEPDAVDADIAEPDVDLSTVDEMSVDEMHAAIPADMSFRVRKRKAARKFKAKRKEGRDDAEAQAVADAYEVDQLRLMYEKTQLQDVPGTAPVVKDLVAPSEPPIVGRVSSSPSASVPWVSAPLERSSVGEHFGYETGQEVYVITESDVSRATIIGDSRENPSSEDWVDSANGGKPTGKMHHSRTVQVEIKGRFIDYKQFVDVENLAPVEMFDSYRAHEPVDATNLAYVDSSLPPLDQIMDEDMYAQALPIIKRKAVTLNSAAESYQSRTPETMATLAAAKQSALRSIGSLIGFDNDETSRAISNLNVMLDSWRTVGGLTTHRSDMHRAMRNVRAGIVETDDDRALLLQRAWSNATWDIIYKDKTVDVNRFVTGGQAAQYAAAQKLIEPVIDADGNETRVYNVDDVSVSAFPLSSWTVTPKGVLSRWIGKDKPSVELTTRATRDEVWLHVRAEPTFRTRGLKAPGEFVLDDSRPRTLAHVDVEVHNDDGTLDDLAVVYADEVRAGHTLSEISAATQVMASGRSPLLPDDVEPRLTYSTLRYIERSTKYTRDDGETWVSFSERMSAEDDGRWWRSARVPERTEAGLELPIVIKHIADNGWTPEQVSEFNMLWITFKDRYDTWVDVDKYDMLPDYLSSTKKIDDAIDLINETYVEGLAALKAHAESIGLGDVDIDGTLAKLYADKGTPKFAKLISDARVE